MERVHLESEIQQVLPPLLDHPSAGVLSSRGWGVDSATRVGLTLPDSVEPGTTPVSLLPGGSGMEVGDTRRMPR